MGRVTHHQLDIYGAWLHAAGDLQAWKTVRRRVPELPSIEEGALGFTSRDVGADGAVHLSTYLNTEALADNPVGFTEILAHEACHSAALLLDHVGQEYDGESEALAYLVGFVAAWLHTALVDG